MRMINISVPEKEKKRKKWLTVRQTSVLRKNAWEAQSRKLETPSTCRRIEIRSKISAEKEGVSSAGGGERGKYKRNGSRWRHAAQQNSTVRIRKRPSVDSKRMRVVNRRRKRSTQTGKLGNIYIDYEVQKTDLGDLTHRWRKK